MSAETHEPTERKRSLSLMRIFYALGIAVIVLIVVGTITLSVKIYRHGYHPEEVPQVMHSMLKHNLELLRSAIAQFHTDTGVYPARLEDLVATESPKTGASDAVIPKGSYKGPYLNVRDSYHGSDVDINDIIGNSKLPRNWCAAKGDPDVSHHWTYTPATGTVKSAVPGTTLDGVAYTAL
jgi:hypothetical protein